MFESVGIASGSPMLHPLQMSEFFRRQMIKISFEIPQCKDVHFMLSVVLKARNVVLCTCDIIP